MSKAEPFWLRSTQTPFMNRHWFEIYMFLCWFACEEMLMAEWNEKCFSVI